MTTPAEPPGPTLCPVDDDGTRRVVEQLAQLYRHDMSEFLGHLPREDGTFAFSVLPSFFTEPDRRALLIASGPVPAGFALTRTLEDGAGCVSAFFVVRALRGRGVGRRAALELLRTRPGPWAIAFQTANTGAARFWRRIAEEAAGPGWTEELRPVPPPAPAGLPPDNWILLDTGGRADVPGA
ncbi:GNAT family N-acetyltransferase [Streptomyces sp. CAU 1734]|uniref:GNAT family N-acetyltransferase n=1 Tax=Streptomyces sp. CAU 1734 TaxID=3140360 RepID=UPI003260EE9C